MHQLIEKNLRDISDGVGVDTEKFSGSTILITGGCGFLGSWFVAFFQELNKNFKKAYMLPCKVIVIDSFIATDKRNHIAEITDSNIEFLQKDINELNLPGLKVRYGIKKFDYVIHAAGVASPIYYRKYPIETIKGMVLGLIKLMDHAVYTASFKLPIKSMLVFSSSEIYGNPYPEFVPTKEEYNGNVSCTGPRSCYDESKRLEETICTSFHNIHNVPVKWVRPFNVYGPGMRLADDRVVPKFMFQALRGEKLTVHLPSIQTRTFCYITDAMIGFLKTLLIGKDGNVYNIGNNEPELSMIELTDKMKEIIPGLEIDHVEMPPEYPRDQAQRRCPDISKAYIDLAYLPEVSIEDGLAMTKEWCEEVLKNEKS